jgi:hypothetical protein
MNQSFPCTYGPIYHGTIFFYFLKKYLKKLFGLPGLPSNKKNSSDHHNSYNKGPNLAVFSFIESPSNILPTIKFPKNHITSSYHSNMPKTAKAKIWPLRTLGVKVALQKPIHRFKQHKLFLNNNTKSAPFQIHPNKNCSKLSILCLQSNLKGILNF